MPLVRCRAAILLAGLICICPAIAAQARATSDLERAYRIVRTKNFVDLTHAFGPDTPVWAGFGQREILARRRPKTGEPYTIPKDEFPCHLLPDGRAIRDACRPAGAFRRKRHHHGSNSAQADDFCGWSCSTTHRTSAKIPTTPFRSPTSKPGNGEHGRVPKGAFAALRTDMYKDWDSNPNVSSASRSRLVVRHHQISL